MVPDTADWALVTTAFVVVGVQVVYRDLASDREETGPKQPTAHAHANTVTHMNNLIVRGRVRAGGKGH